MQLSVNPDVRRVTPFLGFQDAFLGQGVAQSGFFDREVAPFFPRELRDPVVGDGGQEVEEVGVVPADQFAVGSAQIRGQPVCAPALRVRVVRLSDHRC